MLPSYESPLRFQEGWSSLQTHSRTPRNPPRGLTLQMGMLGNLKARTALRMCSKNLQLAPNCGSWVSLESKLLHPDRLSVIAKMFSWSYHPVMKTGFSEQPV